MASLPGTKAIPADAHWASVTLTTDGLPDEVVAVAASYDSSLRYGAQTPFSDQLALQWEGGQWQYDPQHDSIITAGNGSAQPTQTAFTIFYNQGTQKYELDQTLQPGQQMWMDIGKLIREGTPDKNGNTLPADLSSGSYDVRDLTNKTTATLFEGKVIYDKTYGHVTYGCAACCGYFIPILWYNPINIFYQGLEDDGVQAWYPCESEYDDVSSPFYYNWSSGDTSIATVNSYGTHTGVSVGFTTSQTNGNLMSNDAKNLCPALHRTPSGGANVNPQILLGGPSGTNITNNSSNPQSVVVGQQIILYAKYQSGLTVNSQTWTVPGTTVAGYTPTTSSSSLNTNVVLNQQSTTFYWAFYPSSPTTVTFTLNYGSGQTATAQAFFSVSAPPGGMPTVTYPTNQLLTIDTLTGCSSAPTQPFLVFGNITGPVPPCPGTYGGLPGIAFSPPTGATPPGTFFFVQLVTSDYLNYTSLSCEGVPGLDGAYPYQSKYASPVNDAPFAPLPYTSITRDFYATMYLMWQESTTSPSIPVPIASMQWSFQSSSTETNGVWSTPSGGGGGGIFIGATTVNDYPSWTGLAVQANNNCH